MEEVSRNAVEMDVLIDAPIERVWHALTDREAIRGWMGADSLAEIDPRVGGRFQFFFGAATGTITRLDPPHALTYTWRQDDWPSAWPDSEVRWRLDEERSGESVRRTRVRLTHVNFPNLAERDRHAANWERYGLYPMKNWLEG